MKLSDTLEHINRIVDNVNYNNAKRKMNLTRNSIIVDFINNNNLPVQSADLYVSLDKLYKSTGSASLLHSASLHSASASSLHTNSVATSTVHTLSLIHI
jgi:hypothetical protein